MNRVIKFVRGHDLNPGDVFIETVEDAPYAGFSINVGVPKRDKFNYDYIMGYSMTFNKIYYVSTLAFFEVVCST